MYAVQKATRLFAQHVDFGASITDPIVASNCESRMPLLR